MADQEKPNKSYTTSRLSSNEDKNNNNNYNNNKKEEEENHEMMRQEGWLRLSIGHDVKPADLDHRKQHQINPTARREDSFDLKLNLFSGGSSREEEGVDNPLPYLFHHHQQHQEMPLMRPYLDVVAGPSSSFRVIDPPKRSHSGIWLLLQASQNQTIEPFLPQIPKSYLRIKDGKMTIRVLMKYLVNKLLLEHESQIEIRCRGQELEPMLTLQHVRDTIWRRRSRDNNNNLSQNFTLLTNSSSTSDHIMLLLYGRTLS